MAPEDFELNRGELRTNAVLALVMAILSILFGMFGMVFCQCLGPIGLIVGGWSCLAAYRMMIEPAYHEDPGSAGMPIVTLVTGILGTVLSGLATAYMLVMMSFLGLYCGCIGCCLSVAALNPQPPAQQYQQRSYRPSSTAAPSSTGLTAPAATAPTSADAGLTPSLEMSDPPVVPEPPAEAPPPQPPALPDPGAPVAPSALSAEERARLCKLGYLPADSCQ